jgi:hypothetical protein
MIIISSVAENKRAPYHIMLIKIIYFAINLVKKVKRNISHIEADGSIFGNPV